MSLAEFMKESKPISRWVIAKTFIYGAFAGAILGVVIAMAALT